MNHAVCRRFAGGFLAVLAVGLLTSGCDWAQFGAWSSAYGDNFGESAITPSNVSTLTQKFSTATESGTSLVNRPGIGDWSSS